MTVTVTAATAATPAASHAPMLPLPDVAPTRIPARAAAAAEDPATTAVPTSAPASVPTPVPTAGAAGAAGAGLVQPAGPPLAARELLAGSARELLAAGAPDTLDDPEARYARAHLAALRAAAAVLAARAAPQPRSRRSGGVRSAWVLLAEVAPELGEWAAFFAAGAGKRAAAEAGLRGVVSEREADDLVREAESFLAVVARVLGVAHQQALPVEPSRRQGSAGPAIARAS